MHKIYFEKRCIIICSPEEEALADPNSVEFHVGEKLNIHALVRMFEVQDTLSRIYIPTDNIENTYRRICTEFKEVNAAGGLVSNRRGDYLLISRNGLWDLPKGHQEPGEDIEICAMREVQEETGVDQLELRRLICITDHVYFRTSSTPGGTTCSTQTPPTLRPSGRKTSPKRRGWPKARSRLSLKIPILL